MLAHRLGFFLGCSVLVVACADMAMESSDSAPSMGPRFPGSGGYDNGVTDGGADAALPPEEELESSYQSPVATGRFVWVANPASGQVAYIDAVTLQVKTVLAGNGPKYMTAIPHDADDVAVVINELSHDATVLRAKADGSITARAVSVGGDMNAWAVSPNGQWAIAWTNSRTYPNLDPLQGFQDITVIGLAEGAETFQNLSIGYRPVTVSFSSDETHAYAVTQDGVSVIDLTLPQGPQTTKLVAMSEDPLDDPGSHDVSITPDGAFALVRWDGSKELTVVSLKDGDITTIELPFACTDLDLSADGTKALAALRDAGQVAILPIPGIITSPDSFSLVTIDSATAGSVAIASESPVALVYTNAVAEQTITKIGFDVSPPYVKTFRLHGAVQSVFPAPNGSSAIILHQPMMGALGAFSVLHLAPELPAKIVSTKAYVSAVAISKEGDRAVVTERDDVAQIHGAYLIRTANQQVDRYPLGSPPIAVGTVPSAKRAYIAQEHPEGRLTFIDLDTGLARTLTGFELGTRVVDGSGE